VGIDFEVSTHQTLGVEWELALVDKVTRDLSNTAFELFAAVRERRGAEEPRLHQELLRNTVEVVSGICGSVDEAVGDLVETLRVVRRSADDLGVDLYCAGTHPFAQWSHQVLTPDHRYEELIERTQWWGRQMLIWGVHVHVGVKRREHVFPIISALLSQFPHLQALSASSPIWASTDTGYASNRAMMYQQLPTAGLPLQFECWEEFEIFVAEEEKTGVIESLRDLRWDIRPSPRFGTVEVRVCDSMSTLTELRAVVALTHCLVVDLEDRLEAGETLPTLPSWHVRENKWRAARYGLDAEIILDRACRERPVTEDLADLLCRLEPVARRLGCASDLAAVADIPKNGASYQRQRKVAAETDNDLVAVVDSVVKELQI
jgi:glutamate---cysteine ligase / carboxylate-amine ligase